MKKLLCTFAVIGALSVGTTAFATVDIGITVRSKPIATDSPPIDDQGRVLVPIRAVSEALGAAVDWDAKTDTVVVRKWSQTIKLTVGKKTAATETFGNNSSSSGPISLDVPAKAVHNRVYVPLRFVSEQYGYKVEWKNNTVAIESPLSDKQRDALYTGDLAASRNLVMEAMFSGTHYEHTPLRTLHESEDYSTAFLFPEGEALRFFTIEGNETATYYEYKDDFLVATWQAHFDGSIGDSFQLLLEEKLKDRTGPTPKIDKPLVFYSRGIAGDSSTEESGLIGLDGKVTRIGFEHTVGGSVTDSSGKLTVTQPDEVRKEVVPIPQN
ncbi:stalk domain-containing protein [Paenibacillus sp. CMM36]